DWGQQNPTSAHNRLGYERADRIGPFASDNRLDCGDHSVAERRFVFAVLGEPIVMWATGVDHVGWRQIPGVMIDRNPCEAGSGRGETMIPAGGRDDLLLVWLTSQVIVVANQLVVRVIGVGTRAAEEHAFQMLGVGMFVQEGQDFVR